ncbi:MAG TPA: LEA type 2 family protein [Xanthomonadales bacterium]|nr:LEA type 2 family protein [Xanthomonadales bacterium]
MTGKNIHGKRAMSGWGLLFTAALMLTSCASLTPDDEKPVVILKSFNPSGSGNGTPGFEITLGVINPSPRVLDIHGVVYTISVQGNELVKGVGKDFPPVESYSEAELKLSAQPNLLAGIRMFAGMMNQPTDGFEYEFEARLDTGGWSVPIRVREVGRFNLGGPRKEP